jgi:hypothetical protein
LAQLKRRHLKAAKLFDQGVAQAGAARRLKVQRLPNQLALHAKACEVNAG